MLFDQLKLREVTFKNRVAVSPMCQYSSEDGFANDWHLVHLGAFATGGAGLISTEASAVTPEGRISPQDLGIWKDEQIPALERITKFIKANGSVPGMQLAHAGRKGSTAVPWAGGKPLTVAQGGFSPIYAPMAEGFYEGHVPEALDEKGITRIVQAFGAAAERALQAGFQFLEIHGAHGYLIHEFYSPLSNRRSDAYGQDRHKLALEVTRAVRKKWPERLPLFFRVSASDWTEGGWDVEQSIELAKKLKAEGVDLIDCSSGGNVPTARIPAGPGYQSHFAEKVRAGAAMPTGAVGMITSPHQAEHILRTGQADLVFLAREMLRQPHWALAAAHALGVKVDWPKQYERAQ
ncbi:MAG TPA: NADH:flavin oxidoreductase/NADH oxidase [Myxococcales bacterium]|jgi:2,4-dienoyl-CoA reductase-like NADH-dependent reductase (Old Yellow Enzyme family)|nr:NADH:flavin oxidoreductase/NADH oxidase [Myxococcales bacterium]